MSIKKLNIINLFLCFICIAGIIIFIKTAIDYKLAVDELNRVNSANYTIINDK